jgi:ABC-type dipeptide/oligopeptide/nickel transport system ATPase component
MRQPAMIAMALACNPKVLIADEPTTALDVTTQAEILRLIRRLHDANGVAVLFITHDMGVVAQIADEVLVMHDGHVVEQAEVRALFADAGQRYPHAFSGGQRQRIVIARALALDPRLIIEDEATSALDVTLGGQILDLLLDLQPRLGLSFICIGHDLGVIRYFCNRVAVMYRGEILEIGDADAICARPTQPYTQKLLAAVPAADPTHRFLAACRTEFIWTG